MPDLPPDRSQPSVGRRGVLAWAGALALPGAALVGGCDDDPGTTPGAAPASPTAPAAEADTALLASVRASLETALGVTSAVAASTSPALARAGDRLTRLHRAHADELGLTLGGASASPSTPASPSPAPSGGTTTPARDRRRLLAAELTLQQALVAAALAARSGGLAQLLASMAAAIAQQRAVLA